MSAIFVVIVVMPVRQGYLSSFTHGEVVRMAALIVGVQAGGCTVALVKRGVVLLDVKGNTEKALGQKCDQNRRGDRRMAVICRIPFHCLTIGINAKTCK